MRTLVVAITVLLAACGAGAEDRLILVSFDGLGQQIVNDDPVAAELTALQGIAARGVSAAGVLPAAPSTTANSHAAIWTGTYHNGVLYNSNPYPAKSGRTVRERRNGFRAESLLAEPLWVTAGRQGVPAVAHQATQAYPFLPGNTAPEASAPPVVVNGYQTKRLAPHQALRKADVEWTECDGWTPALPAPARCFGWTAGEVSFHAAIVEQAIWVALDKSGPRVSVAAAPLEEGYANDRPLARHFSDPLPVNGVSAVYFRLFEFAPGGSDFLLFQSVIQESGLHDGKRTANEALEEMVSATGPFLPNGPVQLYRSGRLGPALLSGGTGVAERRYLEVVELITRQFNRHSRWLWEHYQPRLLLDYFPYPDEVDHTWLGLVRTPPESLSADSREKLHDARRWAYRLINRRLETLAGLAGAEDHILVTGDHGMAAVSKVVKIDQALARHGLDGDAVHLRYSILLNGGDWVGGAVEALRREETLARVTEALASIRDPETGERVVTRIERVAQRAGHLTADLTFDLRPGYAAVDSAAGPMVEAAGHPFGTHGLSPVRPDMRTILAGAGPRLERGAQWPLLRSIDIAPLVADLLGIDPPKNSEGRSPLAAGGVANGPERRPK